MVGICPGGICPAGICPGSICPGGICPAGICPDTATYMYVQCRYITNNPHHVVLENKISKISFKFRAITNLSGVPLNPWLIPRIKHPKIKFVLQWIYR